MNKRSGPWSIALLLFLVHLGCVKLASGNEDFSAGCFDSGLNPHPTHRCRYLVCKEDANGNLIAHQYGCPEYEIYSHSEQSCVPEDKMEACDRVVTEGDPECNKRALNCKDCSTLVICAEETSGIYKVIDNYTCPDLKKYCDNEIQDCTNLQPIQCVPHAGCTSEGIFPSINNCSIYYNCSVQGDELKDTVGVCPKGFVFNPAFTNETNICKHRDRPQDCITVPCSGVLEKKAYHEGSSYYVVCTPDGQGYVFNCGDGIKYDSKNKQCEKQSTTAATSPVTKPETTPETTAKPTPPTSGDEVAPDS